MWRLLNRERAVIVAILVAVAFELSEFLPVVPVPLVMAGVILYIALQFRVRRIFGDPCERVLRGATREPNSARFGPVPGEVEYEVKLREVRHSYLVGDQRGVERMTKALDGAGITPVNISFIVTTEKRLGSELEVDGGPILLREIELDHYHLENGEIRFVCGPVRWWRVAGSLSKWLRRGSVD